MTRLHATPEELTTLRRICERPREFDTVARARAKAVRILCGDLAPPELKAYERNPMSIARIAGEVRESPNSIVRLIEAWEDNEEVAGPIRISASIIGRRPKGAEPRNLGEMCSAVAGAQ